MTKEPKELCAYIYKATALSKEGQDTENDPDSKD